MEATVRAADRARVLRDGTAVLPAVLLGLFLATAAQGFQLYLGYDQFFYVRNARALARGLWPQLTAVWPIGYPLAGAPFIFAGLSAAEGLLCVNALSFGLILYLCGGFLREAGCSWRERMLLLAGLAALPAWHYLLATPMSETLFTAVLLATLAAVARIPSGRGLWAAASGVSALYLVRYIGIVFLPLVPAFLLIPPVLATGTSRKVALSIAVPVLTVAAYSMLNAWAFGAATGESRLIFDPDIFRYAADLGASFFGLLGRYAPASLPEPLRSISGGIITAVLLGCSLVVLLRYRGDALLRAGALIVLLYIAGLIVVRVFAYTDIEAARMSLPLIPVFFILLLRIGKGSFRRLMLPVALACIALGCLQAYRGYMARAPMDAVSEAESVLRRVAKPEDLVLVSYPAKSIARSVDADVRFYRHPSEVRSLLASADFIVIVTGGKLDGSGFARSVWESFSEQAGRTDMGFVPLHRSANVSIFRRTGAR